MGGDGGVGGGIDGEVFFLVFGKFVREMMG